MDINAILGLQPMNINNEQRKAFAKIVYDNGRSHEFYEKFGQNAVLKNRTKAEAVLAKLVDIKNKVKALEKAEEKALAEVKNKIQKATALVERNEDKLIAELDKLGYSMGTNGYGSERTYTLQEDTSRLNAEYEMFKKRAIADIWGADTLEKAKEAIDKYLNLEVK